MKAPLVSVVLPTRNREDFLRNAVASVLNQSESDWELIVVDDASTDGTPEYLAALAARDPRVRSVRNATPKGGGGSRNEGLRLARGTWVAFLDDDDEWVPFKLRRQLELLAANASVVACSCSYIRLQQSGRTKVVTVPRDVTLADVLLENVLGSASLCVASRAVLHEIGGFDAAFRSAQDQDLWVRLLQRGKIVVCEEPLVLYRSHVGPRITNDLQSQYSGSRRFYFKHRDLMDASLRRRSILHTCFLMSRQQTRPARYRARYLLLALLQSSPRVLLRYARSSVPRLARDALFGRLQVPSPRG